MLRSLSIKNIVLIEKLQLDFSSGFTVFSGENGWMKKENLITLPKEFINKLKK